MKAECVFCDSDGGLEVYRDECCRVVIADDPIPGFCRVVWNAHVREMTDLPAADRRHVMDVVFAVEAALREFLRPDKMNVASLGNLVPHVHWHVVPRFATDAHFPSPVWSAPQRKAEVRALPPNFAQRLAARLAADFETQG